MNVMAGLSRIKGLLLIVRRSLRQHALATLITAFSIALGSGLVMAVFAIRTQTYQAFTDGEVGFDAVLGARGSQLQLVLNTVFHLETSPGNIPWALIGSLGGYAVYDAILATTKVIVKAQTGWCESRRCAAMKRGGFRCSN
jgi:hypothetical protein